MKFCEVCKRNKHENIIYQVLQVTILKWSIRKFPKPCAATTRAFPVRKVFVEDMAS